MKLHTIQTLVTLFVAVFALTKGEETEDVGQSGRRRRLATASAFKAYSNNLVLGETRTETYFEFALDATVAVDSTIVITASGNIWAGVAACGCLLTSNNVALPLHLISATSQTALTITAKTAVIPAETIRITCSNTNNEPNAASVTHITFDIDAGTNVAGEPGWTVGRISMYYRKSECRTDSKDTGALTNCVTNAAEASSDCYSPQTTNCPNFIITTGKQEESDGCTPSANTRCDALSFSYNSLDIAFNTNGNYGVATCGAYLVAAAIPDRHIRYQTIGNDLRSRQSVEVTEGNKKSDHTLTLIGLAPDTRYKLRCHMDDYDNIGEDLKVWTDKNLRVWGISLTPDILTASSAISKMTLSFYHGSTMTGHATTTTIAMVTGTAIWSGSGATSCTMYKTPIGGSETQVTQFSATAASTTSITFSVLAGGSSAAGSKIKIECTSNLANNPSATTVQITSLDVVSKGGSGAGGYTHKTVEKVNTYSTV